MILVGDLRGGQGEQYNLPGLDQEGKEGLQLVVVEVAVVQVEVGDVGEG